MKTKGRFLIVLVLVLVVTTVATPVAAAGGWSPPVKLVGPVTFTVDFWIYPGYCKVQTGETATQHFLATPWGDRKFLSTNVGSVSLIQVATPPAGAPPCELTIPLPTPITIPAGTVLPFTVVDIFPFSNLATRTHAIAGAALPGFPLSATTPSGANAWLVRTSPSPTYCGYVYVKAAEPTPGSDGFLKVPFVATANGSGGFQVSPNTPCPVSFSP